MEGRSPSVPKACLPLINPRKFNVSHDRYGSYAIRNSKCLRVSRRTKSNSQCSDEPENSSIPVSLPTIKPECNIGTQGIKKLQKLLSISRSQGVGTKMFISCFEANNELKDCAPEIQIHVTPPDPFVSPLGTTHAYELEKDADLASQVSHHSTRGRVLCCQALETDSQTETAVDPEFPPLPYTYLLPMKPKDVVRGMKTLVLNLNGILIHPSLQAIDEWDFKIPAWINRRLCEVFVVKRPGVEQFLATVARMYEVIVFTACPRQYTDLILDVLDKRTKCIQYRLYEDAGILTDDGWVKDLSVLGRDLTKVISVDSKPNSYRLHPANSLQVGKFVGDKTDRELDDLLLELELVWRLNI